MEEPVQRRRAWDPIVKLTHWGVVTAVIANAIFTEEGSGWHIWVGYGLAALLALRLLWGLIGPAEARFSAFPPSPRRALAHIAEIRRGEVVRHRSHNPLGAMMVYESDGGLVPREPLAVMRQRRLPRAAFALNWVYEHNEPD